MRMWIFNHYAEGPEGFTTRPFDIGRRVVERGHQVTIFASSFSHYSFRETRLRGIELWRREVIEGVEFFWIRTFPYRWNDWRRVANWVSYFLLAVLAAVVQGKRPDLVIGVSVHPLAALAGWVVARLKGA